MSSNEMKNSLKSNERFCFHFRSQLSNKWKISWLGCWSVGRFFLGAAALILLHFCIFAIPSTPLLGVYALCAAVFTALPLLYWARPPGFRTLCTRCAGTDAPTHTQQKSLVWICTLIPDDDNTVHINKYLFIRFLEFVAPLPPLPSHCLLTKCSPKIKQNRWLYFISLSPTPSFQNRKSIRIWDAVRCVLFSLSPSLSPENQQKSTYFLRHWTENIYQKFWRSYSLWSPSTTTRKVFFIFLL